MRKWRVGKADVDDPFGLAQPMIAYLDISLRLSQRHLIRVILGYVLVLR